MTVATTDARAERTRIAAIFDEQIEEWETAAKAEKLSPRLRDEFAAVAGRILRRKVLS